jgi:small-conductance mechanosensitive channel
VVQATTGMLSPQQRTATARAAQGATLLVALLVGADQIGLKVTWLAILVALVLVCLLGGLALTISLGARTYVANLIGAHYMAQALQVGQSVRVAGFQGSVVELTATSLVLETPQGKVMLPGSVYHDGPIEVLVPES